MQSDQELLKNVVDRSQEIPVVVDFWAEWCQPCKTLTPVLERLADTAPGEWELVKINVDDYQMLAAQFGVQSIPSVKMIYQGRLVNEFNGALPESEVVEWLEQNLPERPKSDMEQIQDLIREGHLSRARPSLEHLLKEDPKNDEVKVWLAHCLVFDKPDRALSLVSEVQETSDFYDKATKIGILADLLETNPKKIEDSTLKDFHIQAVKALKKQKFEEALDACFQILIRDKAYADEVARKGFIAIFDFLGRQHTISKAYARRFEMAMFS